MTPRSLLKPTDVQMVCNHGRERWTTLGTIPARDGRSNRPVVQCSYCGVWRLMAPRSLWRFDELPNNIAGFDSTPVELPSEAK